MSKSIQLSKVANFRDVGLTINQFLGQRLMREGVFYRSARPDEATEKDKELIWDELGIKMIIDLRSRTELLQQAKRLQTFSRGDEVRLVGTRDDPLAFCRIVGIKYESANISGKRFERYLLSQLTWLGFFQVIFFFFIGYRIKGVRVISREVLLPRGLTGMALAMLDHSSVEINRALIAYTQPQELPSLIHCTQGKDRTGLICALLLMILNIPKSAVEYDYHLTNTSLLPSQGEMLAELHNGGLTNDWVLTSSDLITEVERHLRENYHGLDGYLDHIGFTHDQRQRVRDSLLY